MESWAPGCLIQDDEDVAYEPEDKKGKALALYITLKFRLLLHKTKFGAARDHVPPWTQAGQTPNCRCVIRPLPGTE